MNELSVTESDIETSTGLAFDESSTNDTVNVSELISESANNSILESEQSFLIQQDLYGLIQPSPMKMPDKTPILPKLHEKLVLPKQRKRSSSVNLKTIGVKTNSDNHHVKSHLLKKRPSTCGKEGLRNFSTPLPSKIDSLTETPFPCLSPESINTEATKVPPDLIFKTPNKYNNLYTSPISLRSFSTPLAELRANPVKKPTVQIQLNQLLSRECLEETERQLLRDIMKYQSEINLMRKIKQYRDSNESERLNELINKWRDIAEKASNYLYNQAKLKIDRMGGMEEFRNRQKKAKMSKMKFEFDQSVLYRIEEYMDTDEYKNLDVYQKKEVLSRKKELEEMSEKIENGELLSDSNENQTGHVDTDCVDEENEFTMKELYKQMGLDYNLVYGL